MNLLVIIALLVVLWKIVEGYKRGMVKEIISFISLIVMCVVVVLIGNVLQNYLSKDFFQVAVAVMLLCVLGIAHHLLGVVFFSAKVISRLPVVHWVDKMLGAIVGVLETVLIIWTIYTLVIAFGLGMVGQQILAYTEENAILAWLYQYNYLAAWIERLKENVPAMQF